MKKKIKRIDKKGVTDQEEALDTESLEPLAKKPVKNKLHIAGEVVGYGFLAVILLLALHMAVTDPKEFFAQPEEGVRDHVRGTGKYIGMLAFGALYVVAMVCSKIKETLKKWKEKLGNRRR